MRPLSFEKTAGGAAERSEAEGVLFEQSSQPYAIPESCSNPSLQVKDALTFMGELAAKPTEGADCAAVGD